MDREMRFLIAFYGTICAAIGVFLFFSLFDASLAAFVLVVVALFASMAVLGVDMVRSGGPNDEGG
jgi:hypothetical protein